MFVILPILLVSGSDLLRNILGTQERVPSPPQERPTNTLRYYSRAPRSRYMSNEFTTVAYDARCGPPEVVLSSTTIIGLPQCKQRCISDPKCGFFAYWREVPKYCETYVDCDETIDTDAEENPLSGVQIFKRLNECEVQVSGADSPYPKEIAKAFPNGMIRYKPPHKNLHCACVTGCWGLCAIMVEPNSQEEQIAMTVLDRRNLKPPFEFPRLMDKVTGPIAFAMKKDKRSNFMVYAEIEILHYSRCIHISFCTDGTPDGKCPVLGTRFQSGDAVYILNSDTPLLLAQKSVACISAGGIRHISMTMVGSDQDKRVDFIPFRDPFRKISTPLTTSQYSLYYIFDDDGLDAGACSKKESSETGSQSSSDRGSPRGKGRKGKKKAYVSQSPPISEGSAESPPVFFGFSAGASSAPPPPHLAQDFLRQGASASSDPTPMRPGTPEIDDPVEYFGRFMKLGIHSGSSPSSSEHEIAVQVSRFNFRDSFQLFTSLFFAMVILTLFFTCVHFWRNHSHHLFPKEQHKNVYIIFK